MIKAFLTVAMIIAFAVNTGTAHAATIAELQAQLQVLMAQLSALQTQTQTTVAPQHGADSCPHLARNLSRGSRGSDVAQLQQFLISQNLLAADSATGFFGAMTEDAVKQWQSKNGIASSGAPATTGYGAVGPRTRVALTRCRSTPTISVTPTAPSTPIIPAAPIVPTTQTTPTTPSNPATPVSCTPFASQTQTLACPAGQTGSITQTRTSSCATKATSPAWGGWTTTSNTCQTTYVPLTYSGASLNDFWSGNAFFQFIRKQVFPIEDPPGLSGVGANTHQDITVIGSTWYRFSREYDTTQGQNCPGSGGLRIVIHKSTDKGATWTGRTVLVDAGGHTPWACQAADGSAYFDSVNSTWHYLFQCLGETTEPDWRWNLCYASRQNADPLGPFTVDPAPVVRGGDIFKKMNRPDIHDEGTPQIVEKIGNKFYVTFHGYDGVRGYRGIAWTTDFHSWSVDTNTPIFGPSDCASWNVSWNGGCIGSGHARALNDGQYYYMVIEAADGNLACQRNQNWVFGIMRSNNLTNPSWASPAGGAGIIFNTSQLYPDGGGVECGVQYAGLFRDASDTYLSVWRTGVGNGNQDTDPMSGWYLYKLTSDAPLASYSFAQGGTQNKYVHSDIVSRGNLEAHVDNIQWLNPGVQMNGVNSIMTLPANLALKRAAPWSLELVLNVTAETANKSAFIAGDRTTSWIELYPGNQLCAWAITQEGPKNACTQLSLNTAHTVALIVTTSTLTLVVDGTRTTAAISSLPSIHSIVIGSSGPIPEGYYGSWQGILSKVSFYDRAI